MFTQLMGSKNISPKDLNRMQQNAEVVSIFDFNSRRSWMRARVPGAANLDPAGHLESDLPPDKETALVFYCGNPMCQKAPIAARRARKMGYSNVRVMRAGIVGWLAAKLPTESGA